MHNLDYYEELSYDNVVLFGRFFKLLTVDSKEKLEQFKEFDELDAYSKNLEYFSNDKEYVEELMRAEAEEIMRNQEKYFAGFHEGEAKGKLETQTLIVKNLLNNSIPDDIILKSTNISVEEFEKIKKELK